MQNISDLHVYPQALNAQPQQKPPAKTSLSRDQWRSLIAQWAKSGISQKAFCESQKINLNSFTYYRSQFKQQVAKHKIATVKVINNKTNNNPAEDKFILQLSHGTKLFIPPNYNQSSLKCLLALLGIC